MASMASTTCCSASASKKLITTSRAARVSVFLFGLVSTYIGATKPAKVEQGFERSSRRGGGGQSGRRQRQQNKSISQYVQTTCSKQITLSLDRI